MHKSVIFVSVDISQQLSIQNLSLWQNCLTPTNINYHWADIEMEMLVRMCAQILTNVSNPLQLCTI